VAAIADSPASEPRSRRAGACRVSMWSWGSPCPMSYRFGASAFATRAALADGLPAIVGRPPMDLDAMLRRSLARLQERR
jgi:hypothetical protein